MSETGTPVLLVGGPYDGEVSIVVHMAPLLLAPGDRRGDAVYRINLNLNTDPISAEFEGYKRRIVKQEPLA